MLIFVLSLYILVLFVNKYNFIYLFKNILDLFLFFKNYFLNKKILNSLLYYFY